MSHFKIAMATLAVFGSAALINCSEFQGNHSTPGAGPALNSESPTPTAPSEKELAALAFNQKWEYQQTLKADLQAMSAYSYGEDLCSASEKANLLNQNEIIMFDTHRIVNLPPVQRIKDQSQSVEQVKFAVNALAKSLRASENEYCALNVISEVAKFAVSDFLENEQINMSMDTSEAETARLYQFVEKADHVRNGLKSLANEILVHVRAIEARNNWTEMAAEHESLREQIKSKIQMLGQLIELVRDSYNCDDSGGTVVNCSAQELARGASVVNTDNIINQAQAALDEFSISEPGDSRLTEARIENLRNHLHQLTIRENVMKSIVLAIEEQQAQAAESANTSAIIQNGKPQ